MERKEGKGRGKRRMDIEKGGMEDRKERLEGEETVKGRGKKSGRKLWRKE
jgi:hypothetical protein